MMYTVLYVACPLLFRSLPEHLTRVTNWGDVSSLNDVPWSLHAEVRRFEAGSRRYLLIQPFPDHLKCRSSIHGSMLLHPSDLGLKRIQKQIAVCPLSDRPHYSRSRDVYWNQGCRSPVVLRLPWYVVGWFISESIHSGRWCRIYRDHYHVEYFRYGNRWCDCWHSLLPSPESMPSSSSRTRLWLTSTQSTSPGTTSSFRTTSLTQLLSLLSTLVLSLARHRLHIWYCSLHRPTQACTLPFISYSRSYTQTLSTHL